MSILITGGTGFFGRAFVRNALYTSQYSRICVFSRDEAKQAEMRDSIPVAERERVRFFIGDVRDRNRLTRAMEGIDIVVHAAALKRIEVGAYNPIEMVRTNVDGSINVIEAAQDSGVSGVVYLSTDKAYEPISPYGQTKALVEGIMAAARNTVRANGPRFTITRYGNVFNSTGSVVPRWKRMIEEGAKRVPVTNPNCTRFFMRPIEAVELVRDAICDIKSARLAGSPNKSLHIPALPAYRLGDLAEAMGVDMEIIGLPGYEKLHESMDYDSVSCDAPRMSVEELKEELSYV